MERVLLLNGNYEPLASVTVPQAVNLLLGEKVRPVEGVLRKLRTPSTEFVVPEVIVLRRYVNVPARNKKWSRRGVLERDNYTCIFCGVSVGSDYTDPIAGENRCARVQDFTIEHLTPASRGGKSTWANTACACYRCNHTKANRTPHEVGFKLRWEPKTPRTDYWVASGRFPVTWKKYFESRRK